VTRFKVDSHTRYRLRQWLCGKHKTAGAGTGEYPDEYLYENLGLIRLEKLTASRIMFLSFDSIGAVPELGIFDSDGVTGHFKTSQSGSNQNRPLLGALFIPAFLMRASGFSFSSCRVCSRSLCHRWRYIIE